MSRSWRTGDATGGTAYRSLDDFLRHRPMEVVVVGTPSGLHAEHASTDCEPTPMPEREIENKIAIVTGGASGIGRAIALRFARAGAQVGVVDVDDAAGREGVRGIGASGGAAAGLASGA